MPDGRESTTWATEGMLNIEIRTIDTCSERVNERVASHSIGREHLERSLCEGQT